MPADGVVIDTPATCDPVTCDTDTLPPIRHGGDTSEFGRRAAEPFSSVLIVDTELVDKWAEVVDASEGLLDIGATTTTILPSADSTFISLPAVVAGTAAAVAVLPVG